MTETNEFFFEKYFDDYTSDLHITPDKQVYRLTISDSGYPSVAPIKDSELSLKELNFELATLLTEKQYQNFISENPQDMLIMFTKKNGKRFRVHFDMNRVPHLVVMRYPAEGEVLIPNKDKPLFVRMSGDITVGNNTANVGTGDWVKIN